MPCYADAKYTYGYAAQTNKNREFSSSGNITNICLLIPHVSVEIRTPASPASDPLHPPNVAEYIE